MSPNSAAFELMNPVHDSVGNFSSMTEAEDSDMKRRRRRIGLFQGTFSPIHYGHLICAEQMRYSFDLDQVDFAPSANPPHKRFGVLDAEDRYDMTVAATEDHPHFNASRVDIDHGGNGYTLLTIQEIARQYKGAELFYLTSAEYLDPEHKWTLSRWIGGKELFKLCTLLIFPRNTQEISQLRKWAELVPDAKIEIDDVPSPAISSTLIRDLVVEGKSIWYTTPWPVQQLIYKKGHYHRDDTPSRLEQSQPPSKVRRVAVYASQFDPIHYAHLLFAEWIRQMENHDRVVFVPTGRPAYNESIVASAEARYKMCVMATAENPFFDVSRVDIARNTTSYALLVVEDMKREFGPDVEIDYVISSKYLDASSPLYLPKWMGAESLFQQVRFLVQPEDMTKVKQVEREARRIKGARIKVIDAPTLPVDSEQVQSMVRRGQSLRFVTPQGVQASIAKHGLYRT